MFRFTQVGEKYIVLQVSYDDPWRCVRAVDGLFRLLRSHPRQGVINIRRSLDCVAVELDYNIDIGNFLRECEERGWGQQMEETENRETLEVPVCYDPEYGKDLPSISDKTGLTVEQIIELHYSVTYQVWMIGFMPGFPYLGKLPDRLHLERKANPDQHIAAGSVAIAEEYVGIYPFDSPGGWHIIGRTPWRIVDYARRRPSTFDYGMKIRFVPIRRDEFETLAVGVS